MPFETIEWLKLKLKAHMIVQPMTLCRVGHFTKQNKNEVEEIGRSNKKHSSNNNNNKQHKTF